MKDFLITPEEAVELFHHAPGENLSAAIDIYKAYAATDHNSRDAQVFAYGACFNAGIVEGVRRERAKHRKEPIE